MLKTQKIREKAAKQLEGWIQKAEKASEQASDEKLKQEWLRIAGFLHQVLNTVLKWYDQTRFNENLQEAEKLLNEIKEWQEQLEMRERELQIKEAELNRKIAALESSREGGGGRV